MQILYRYYGYPVGWSKDLVAIDEAQNLAPTEFELIRMVNRGRVVLNLFGDVNQHVEGSKGIEQWSDVPNCENYSVQKMRENYRNARQITEYCNRTFGMDMVAINVDGAGVHELNQGATVLEYLQNILYKPLNSGLSSIIVSNSAEARAICEMAGPLSSRVLNLTDTPGELNATKWNLITVSEAKGLEFETVVALSGRMTRNERYIAYTKALDELYIID